ncbi:MAG TPA: HEAT repeat domain-containing protein, partial [Terriglobia bacterium]|nr:HEAT repeat domain-containing protein [Terriglobia bacterium]
MVKAISLQDYYNRLEAFHDPDPMIRIAAIHRAGGKLDRNARLRQTLKDLLDDRDPLIARYSAITLAQSGDASGLHYLVQAISRAQGEDREELDGCLRNCARFPF